MDVIVFLLTLLIFTINFVNLHNVVLEYTTCFLTVPLSAADHISIFDASACFLLNLSDY